MANKTYHRRVFGGKDAEWRGIDQGKGALHEQALSMAMNVTFTDNVFKTRDGQSIQAMDISGSILSAKNTNNMVVVNAGTDLFAEKT